MNLIESVKHCLKNIYKKSPSTKDSSILVATSGGADSLALLDVTQKISPKKVIALHFNHQLRGTESDRDQKLFEDFCKKGNIAYKVGTLNVAQKASLGKESLEMAARDCRYRWFREVAEESRASILMMAHHADDQAELFFIRLLRGTSLKGLGGMQFIASFPYPTKAPLYILRPFLQQRHRDLVQYLENQHISWAEDSTNQDNLYIRNKIRNSVLPYFEEQFSKDLAPLLGRTMSLLQEDDDFIQNQVDTISQNSDIPFENLHKSIQRRILEKQLLSLKLTPNYWVIEYLIENPGKNISIQGRNTHRIYGSSSIEIEPSKSFEIRDDTIYDINLNADKGEITFPTLKLSWEILPASSVLNIKDKSNNTELFDFQKVGNMIHLRHWMPGDRYVPIGMQKYVKLQDAFVNKKIPATLRNTLWIAENSVHEIFWIQKLRIGENFKLTQHTQTVLSLKAESLIR